MSVLLKAADLVKRPVVTLAGDDIAQIKDVVYTSGTGQLSGFTLNGRGVFAGPMRRTLPWQNVHGLGPDAVMVRGEESLAGRDQLRGELEGAGGGVLGARVVTDGGKVLGVVTDLILAVGDELTDAVGYEIEPADDAAPRRQFVPLPDTLAISGEALVVPETAVEFIRDDLAGFGAAVEEFRERLRSGTSQPDRKPEPDSGAGAGHGPEPESGQQAGTAPEAERRSEPESRSEAVGRPEPAEETP